MQITTKLQPPISFSGAVIFFMAAILIASAYIYFKIKARHKEIPEIKAIKENKIPKVQNKYIKQLQVLQNKYENKKISERKVYQRLSKIIRAFVFEVTGIKVTNYTLEEIKKLRMNNLTELIEEYYIHEFSKKSLGNAKESIDKTRKVIVRWK